MDIKVNEYTYTFVDGEKLTVKIKSMGDKYIDWASILADFDKADELNERRETRRHCSYEQYDPWDMKLGSGENIEEHLAYKEMLQKFVKTLTDVELNIYIRRYVEEISQVEVAAEMNITKSRVCTKERRIREKLKKFLKNWYEG